MRDQGLKGRAIHFALPAVAGGLALALLVSAEAGAGTVAVADRSEKYLAASVDLIGARYVNDRDGFSARLTVRDLQRRTATVGFTLTIGKADRTYHVAATRTKAGRKTNLVARDIADGQTKKTCSTFVATWDDTRDRIDLHVPWTCLGDLRTGMRVQGYFGAGKGANGDPDDFLKTVKVSYR